MHPHSRPTNPPIATADQVAALGLKLGMVLAELAQIRRSLDASKAVPSGTSSQA